MDNSQFSDEKEEEHRERKRMEEERERESEYWANGPENACPR